MGGVLRRAGAHVDTAFVVFQYGIFDAVVSDADLGINLFSLLTWRELLAEAHQRKDFSRDVLTQIDEYERPMLLVGASRRHWRRTFPSKMS